MMNEKIKCRMRRNHSIGFCFIVGIGEGKIKLDIRFSYLFGLEIAFDSPRLMFCLYEYGILFGHGVLYVRIHHNANRPLNNNHRWNFFALRVLDYLLGEKQVKDEVLSKGSCTIAIDEGDVLLDYTFYRCHSSRPRWFPHHIDRIWFVSKAGISLDGIVDNGDLITKSNPIHAYGTPAIDLDDGIRELITMINEKRKELSSEVASR